MFSDISFKYTLYKPQYLELDIPYDKTIESRDRDRDNNNSQFYSNFKHLKLKLVI